MDPLLRPSEQTSELGRVDSSWQQVEGLSQPKGGEWKPDETLGADAELSRSLTKVVQQLQWLQAQREATAIDGQVLSSSIEELVLPQRQSEAGSGGGASTAQGQPRLLLVLHTGVGNWQQLAANLPPETDLLLLDQQHSGLQQIGEHLSHQAPHGGYGGLMLVLPPGQAGCLELGSDRLQQAQLNGCRDQLSQWSRGLQAGAPLTLVVGGTPADQQALEPLLQELAALTHTEAQLAAAPVDTTATAAATPATSTAVSIGPAAPELLAQARADLQRTLQAGRLQAALVQAYGDTAALEVEPVLQLFLKGELEPQLHWARMEADGINGAFVASHDLILVNQQLAAQAGLQRAVVLEELGHWLEQRAGLLDSVGDEGQRLAVALLGQSLSRQSREGTDDDHSWLQVGDARVAVELSSNDPPTFSNDPPTLTSVATINGASEDSFKEITYADLAAAANEADVDGDPLSFRIDTLSTGTLEKWDPSGSGAWVAVNPGSTLLATGEKLQWKAAANANGTLNAFTVSAYDGSLASATPVQVQVSVGSTNDAPVASGTATLAAVLKDSSAPGGATVFSLFSGAFSDATAALAQQLQLTQESEREVSVADGRSIRVPYVGPVKVSCQGRLCFVGALVLGDDVLLGAVPMEDMDLTINPSRQRLEPDPRSPDIPHALVKTLNAQTPQSSRPKPQRKP